MLKRVYTISLFIIIFVCNATAREYIVEPQWYVGKSDFREAAIDKENRLTDSYTLMDSDTVNAFSTGTGSEYHLNVNVMITNLHNNSKRRYEQYYKNADGRIKKGKSADRPVYGWVWGMKDMLHYNALWLRPSKLDDDLYANETVEYCVVSINGSDTTYFVNWKQANFPNMAFNNGKNNIWLQYNNNTLWVGGGFSMDIPWSVVHNIPSFGNLTGLYLCAGAKVVVEDALIAVIDKGTIEQTHWNRYTLDQYFTNNTTSMIEGFWDVLLSNRMISNVKMGGKYKFAIVKDEEIYKLIYIDGAEIYPGKWNEGAVKAILKPNIVGYYEVVWYDAECEMIDNIMAAQTGNEIIFEFLDEGTELILQRTTNYDIPRMKVIEHYGTGSGFAVSSDGYIVTNYHVVCDGKDYKVCHYDNNVFKSYSAEVIAVDSIYDLAILQINDTAFQTLDTLPYTITDRKLRNGEELFNSSFPVVDILNYSLKNTTGILTSISGLHDFSYMTSLNLDYGSSGSCVFDGNGDIVGVIFQKIKSGLSSINATYAIKTEYLISLMESIGLSHNCGSNKLKELPLPDRIEVITPYMFLIYVSY